MTPIEGKVAIVTGAGRGLGLAMTRGLVAAGARVAMAELDEDVVRAAAREFGDSVIAVSGDVSNPNDAGRIVGETVGAFGDPDALVNNAGLGPQRFRSTDRSDVSMVWEIELADWLLYLDANVTGHFVMTKAVMPGMLARNRGRIVNVTTSFETMIAYTNGAYGPSKAAAEALATMIAGGVAGTGVTCNVLIPGGPADTRMISAAGKYANRAGLIQPEVMVPPLLYLLSDDSAGINDRRIRAAVWDTKRTVEENLDAASAPIAWPQLGGQAIQPDG